MKTSRLKTRLPASFLAAFLLSCGNSVVEKGATCLRLGDYTGAAAFFKKALQRNPADYDARVGMGKALLQRVAAGEGDSSDWKAALTHLEAARSLSAGAELDGLLAEAWTRRARMVLDTRDTLAALDALTRAIERNPEAGVPLNLAGIIYFRRGSDARAATLFSKALEFDDTNAETRFNLGMVYYHQGKLLQARRQWLKALEQRPEDPDIVYWFARAEKEARE